MMKFIKFIKKNGGNTKTIITQGMTATNPIIVTISGMRRAHNKSAKNKTNVITAKVNVSNSFFRSGKKTDCTLVL